MRAILTDGFWFLVGVLATFAMQWAQHNVRAAERWRRQHPPA
ncbi:MAG TPA: hypothetical protein VGZ02_05810 [Candidatus Baltobacteraceae bacterium]|nr:hypothetical protein [Candidatus Baltobacteraceae bacterium]